MSGRVNDVLQTHTEISPHIHKVELPPKLNIWKEFQTSLKESFCLNEPSCASKGRKGCTKFLFILQAIFLILEWGRSYNLTKFKGDLIAGLTIASLCVPQAKHFPTIYSDFVPPLIYASMGSSRHIVVGPVSLVSLMLGNMLLNEIDPSDKHAYRRLAFTATFFAGITQFALGFFRLGFLIDFLSHAAIVGFMSGSAITIALQRLKGFLGIKSFTKNSDILHHGWNWQTIIIGVSFLAFLLLAKHIGKKHPRNFWVSAVAPLTSVIEATIFVGITHADKQGVQIVSYVSKGINPSYIHEIYWTGDFVLKGFRIGVIASFLALTDAIVIGRTFAAVKNYQVDVNKEMVALGTMNIVDSMTSCYVATFVKVVMDLEIFEFKMCSNYTCLSKHLFPFISVNVMAGCETVISNIVMSFVIFLTLEPITPLFKYTPNAVLSSIIIAAVVGLVDVKAVLQLWKIDKFEFLACMGTFLGVVFKNVEIGLLIAVAISLSKILLHITRSKTVVLGKLPGTNVYRNVEQYPNATTVYGILIIRIDAAIYFLNSSYIKERILRWLSIEVEELKENNQPRIQYLVIDMSQEYINLIYVHAAVTDIDTSGIHSFKDLQKILKHRDVKKIHVLHHESKLIL
ncbi:hypothetical protein RGQ29_006272 [Quercus rubra]|uniref:STAS domain-containing protein n=1 Tax=Quercus rubra TaxID=3512 RepID=A0AAN7E6R0_QUERU|nr:hypothetical protein RGQ29_006272 [Quercus rubra]